MLQSSVLCVILSTSEAKARKCSNRAFWNSFCRLLEPKQQNTQIEPSGAHLVDFWSQSRKILQIEPSGSHFVYFWSQCQKVLKSSFLDIILSTSEATARKCSNLASWKHFVDFCSQCRKVLKSSLRELILQTSGANARKYSNNYSFLNFFCRLLEPMPESFKSRFLDSFCRLLESKLESCQI